MLTIRPLPDATMLGRTSWLRTNAPPTLISNARHHSGALTSQSCPAGPEIPALLMSRPLVRLGE